MEEKNYEKDLASFVPGRLRHSGRSNCSDRLRRQQLQHCFWIDIFNSAKVYSPIILRA